MKLYITAPSPFARKVRIVAREKGLSDRIEEIATDPYADAPDLFASNPIVQVPALIAADGAMTSYADVDRESVPARRSPSWGFEVFMFVSVIP